LYFRSGSRGAA
jgi:hypothetical protein